MTHQKPCSLTRNQAAIAKVAAPLPVNANEADLVPSLACSLAQCIASRAQAEDVLRRLHQHAGDIALVIRLDAQYRSMVRTSLSVHGRLMRVQALRQKAEATGGSVSQDAMAMHIGERSMLGAVDPDAAPVEAASPEGARKKSPEGARKKSPEGAQRKSPERTPAKSPEGAQRKSPERTPAKSPEGAPAERPGPPPVEPPPAYVDQTTRECVPQNGTESRVTALETWLSEKSSQRQPRRSRELDPHEVLRQAVAKAHSPDPQSPANRRKGPAVTNHGRRVGGQTAPA